MLEKSSHSRLILPCGARSNNRPPPSSGISAFSFQLSAFHKRAFTLIELLAVIAIIGLLAGITFGVVRGVKERSNIAKAKAELAAISAALENYKRQYGDYPQTDDSKILLLALIGKKGPTGVTISGKPFIETTKLTIINIQGEIKTDEPTPSNNLSIGDPWKSPYQYFYKSTTPWEHPAYILYSQGQDKGHQYPTGSDIKKDHAKNADNIYANEQ